jgi:hypothetical protein
MQLFQLNSRRHPAGGITAPVETAEPAQAGPDRA